MGAVGKSGDSGLNPKPQTAYMESGLGLWGLGFLFWDGLRF